MCVCIGVGACSANEHPLAVLVCRSLVRVQNPDDRYCMARAVLLGLMNRQCRLMGYNQQLFQQMCAQQHLHGQLAQELLQLARCRLDKPAYGLPDLQRIQRALDLRMGVGQVRIVVFDQQAAFQVMWKGSARALFNLCLVFNGNHYDYVAQPEQLVKVCLSACVYILLCFFLSLFLNVLLFFPYTQARAYCVECESRVTNRTHPDGCKAVCRQCYQFGMEQPCKPDGTPRLRCAHCGFHFANAACFAAHQRVMDPAPPGFSVAARLGRRPRLSLCQQRWVCGGRGCRAVVWARSRRPHRCGAAAWVAQQRQRPRPRQLPTQEAAAAQQHANVSCCRHCWGPHAPKMPCFIQPRAYEDKCQTEELYPNANLDTAAATVPTAAALDDDDGDEGPPQLVAEEPGAAAAPPRRRRPSRDELSPPPLLQVQQPQQQQQLLAVEPMLRKPIRFLWWDVETWLDADHKHIPVLICAEVLCERSVAHTYIHTYMLLSSYCIHRCIRASIHIVEHPHRRAPYCLCGGVWQSGGRNRARWCMPMAEAQAPLTTDGRNPRRLHFHNFGGDEQPAMVQFADFLLRHGPKDVTTIALSHNGVSFLM